MRYRIEIFWSDKDRAYVAIAPELPGCSARGQTPAEVTRKILDAQAAWVETQRMSGKPDPNRATA